MEPTQPASAGSPEATASFTYRHIMLALDNSAHSSRGLDLGLALASAFGARVTGAHAYAAKLHDLRFKQMEGGLPERYRREEELEKQRQVHDTLITRGLEIITDSYLDVLADRAGAFDLTPQRKSLEGKNYRALLDDIAGSDYDLVVLGALGLGTVEESLVGSVCERVVRHTDRDVLVAKDPELELGDGPVMVAVDGSSRSFAALKTALSLARRLDLEVEVVSAFDPFFHYVAFHSIAGVLSDEAGEVFKFKEQEQLHEEIIDSGLAKIYQAHLAVAEKVAAEEEMEISTELLAGKPFEVILKRVRHRRPSLLVVGRSGVHADGLDELGSNTHNLLRLVPCHVLIVNRQFEPELDDVAEETTVWTEEAEERMERVPGFVRNMARAAILRFAHERGHTVVSSSLVDEAVANLLPPSAMEAMGMVAAAAEKRRRTQAENAVPQGREAARKARRTFDGRTLFWEDEAKAALEKIADPTVREAVELRAEKMAHRDGTKTVTAGLVSRVAGEPAAAGTSTAAATAGELSWEEDALARLQRVPEGFMRARARQRVEACTRELGETVVTLELCEAGLAEARRLMAEMMSQEDPPPR